MKKIIHLTIALLLLLHFSSCRDDEFVFPSQDNTVDIPNTNSSIKGFYLLNEGNMGMNRASIDYYDYTTGIYTQDLYAAKNPTVVKELGDVGNDIAVYGSKLYAVINCSNYIEVMDATTTKHLAEIEVPNCRNLAFSKGKAYISSYASKVNQANAGEGFVAEIDTTTFTITRKVTVGYQPEGMVIHNNKLYVANSGGYRAPNYDRTVSVVDLTSFQVIKSIDVAINLSKMVIDREGDLYVSSRGDYLDVPSKLYVIDTNTDKVKHTIDVPISNMCLVNDSLYYVSTAYSQRTKKNTVSYGILNTKTDQVITNTLITDGTEQEIMIPYGLAVHPQTKEFIITDAQNYVSSGYVYYYAADGTLKWKVLAGNIPAHIAFVDKDIDQTTEQPDNNGDENSSPYITAILAYQPAPGQFVNILPLYEEGDTHETMCQKVLADIGNNNRGLITLGGFGGSVICGFDHTIQNIAGDYDFQVTGNSFNGSSEPGIIRVAYDKNKNGKPDADEWYELAGSDYHNNTTTHQYEITYTATPADHIATADPNDPFITDSNYIKWTDNQNNEGFVAKNQFHNQDYFPQWITSTTLTFTGTRLANNAVNIGTVDAANYVQEELDFGYADNVPNNDERTKMKIDWAVDAQGEQVDLPGVDWIEIYTGVNQQCGWIGEISTEVTNIIDLHLIK